MKILGIAAFYHDSSATLVVDGEIVAAVQEERFSREKHTAEFPIESIKYCLIAGNMDLSELDAVIFYEKPLPKFERILESIYRTTPFGLNLFVKSMNTWLTEKLFLPRKIKKELKNIGKVDWRKTHLLFSDHHLSHAASTYYPSGFEDAAILVVDGVGEWSTASIYKGKGKKIDLLTELHYPHSLGLLYSAFTYYLGFKVNSGEYKIMGLAPYGDLKTARQIVKKFKAEVIEIYADGSIWLNMKYFNYLGGLTMTNDRKWRALLCLDRRLPESKLQQEHCNIALAAQLITEEVVLKMAHYAKKLTGSSKVCLAGGVALNCVANGKLQELKIFDEMFIQPASGDAGGSLGAALIASQKLDANCSFSESNFDPYLGPEFAIHEVDMFNKTYNLVAQFYDTDSILDQTVNLLNEGKLIGWFQGRMEFGPRALGNRSILANPSKPNIQSKVNIKIKKREGFRPFAPVMLDEEGEKYYDLRYSPYMLLTAKIKEQFRSIDQPNHNVDLIDRLKNRTGKFQAVVHLDDSSRIQTVNETQNEILTKLLIRYKEKTGDGVLLNTSFNVRGEPIVLSPKDAYQCFMNTDLDALVIGNFLYLKEEQTNDPKWQQTFTPD